MEVTQNSKYSARFSDRWTRCWSPIRRNDSAYLAYEAIAHSARISRHRRLRLVAGSELAAALAFAAQHGIPTASCRPANWTTRYARNDGNRCFTVRTSSLPRWNSPPRTRLRPPRLRDERRRPRRLPPGQKAAALHNALAPLAAACLPSRRSAPWPRGRPRLADKPPAPALLAHRIRRAVTAET